MRTDERAERTARIVESCFRTGQVRLTAAEFGISRQRVAQIMRTAGFRTEEFSRIPRKTYDYAFSCGNCGKESTRVLCRTVAKPKYCSKRCSSLGRRTYYGDSCITCGDKDGPFSKMGRMRNGTAKLICKRCQTEKSKSAWRKLKADPKKYGEHREKFRKYVLENRTAFNRERYLKMKADPVRYAMYLKMAAKYGRKARKKLKTDPVRYAEHLETARAAARRRYARMKSDPVRYAEHLETARRKNSAYYHGTVKTDPERYARFRGKGKGKGKGKN